MRREVGEVWSEEEAREGEVWSEEEGKVRYGMVREGWVE